MRNDGEKIAQKKGEKQVVMSCKLNTATANAIRVVIRSMKMNTNQFFQNMCEVVVRYMSPRHNMTPEMEQCMNVFEHLGGWDNAVLHCKPGKTLHINKAIYMLTEEGKSGFLPVMVERPYFGEFKQTENIQSITEVFLACAMPERYKRLRGLAVESCAGSIVQLLDRMINDATTEEEMKQMREEFADNMRSEWGKVMGDAPYRQTRKTDIEKQVSLDFRPFGVEW